jgi:NAD(P)-dependent dehydrogenase (short-subunit alcohol dehydrogenase family)
VSAVQASRLTDKVLIVAGGSAGIGAATAGRMAAEGARVIIGDLNIKGAEATAAKFREVGYEVHAVEFDATDDDSVAALVASAVERYGRLDGLHYNAADLSEHNFGRDTDAVDVPFDVWEHTIDVCTTGCLRAFRHAIPHLVEGGGGSLVATSSINSVNGDIQKVAYSVAKAGINALVRHVARRWGKQSVRANAVAPALTLTEVVLAEERAGWKEQVLSGMAAPRLGEPQDIAALVAFLVSDEAAWITGQTYHINGGLVLN